MTTIAQQTLTKEDALARGRQLVAEIRALLRKGSPPTPVQSIAKFDEAKHPREPGGTTEGGQFTESGHVGQATPDPKLAEQAKTGMAAVEKLLPEAITSADFSKTLVGDVKAHSWGETDEAARKDTYKRYMDGGGIYSDSASDQQNKQHRMDRWDKMSDTEKFLLMDYYGVWAKPMSKDVSGYMPEQWVTGVETGERGEEDYERTHAIALRLTELRTDELRKERGLLEPTAIDDTTFHIREGIVPPDTELDIPAKQGFVAIDSYGNVVASGYDFPQTQINAEHWAKLKGEAHLVDTHDLIENVWKAWKQKSSDGLGMSLQLAAALELGGHHRMTPGEEAMARQEAQKYGGIATLQAYVRAQWEVTQMIMAKAHVQKLDVYRAIMLPGQDVGKTVHQFVDKFGKPIPPPSNIEAHDLPNPHVTFTFAGEQFVQRRMRGMAPEKEFVSEEGSAYEKMMAFNAAHPLEPVDVTVKRRVDQWMKSFPESSGYASGNVFIKLPELQLKRAGAQSTTGTRNVANGWDGVGKRPVEATRVVLRIEAPPTSVLSLPVYGQNAQEEHESVLVGTTDKWLWDAWRVRAPLFESTKGITQKAETPLVIDLQAVDRGQPHWLSSVNWSMQSIAKKEFVEAEHPREPGGSTEGGQFTESGHAGQATPDPKLAEQAVAGIAAVEKLLPEAIKTADYSATAGVNSWEDLDQDTQNEVYDRWAEDHDFDVDTSDIDLQFTKELQKDNQKILDDAVEETGHVLENQFGDPDPTLPVEGEPFNLKRKLDLYTLDYGEGEHGPGHAVELDLEALRFTSGEPLTPAEQQLVKDHWNTAYYHAYQSALDSMRESSAYQEAESEARDDVMKQAWDDLSDVSKFDLANEYVINKKMRRRVQEPKPPDHWTTGVETGKHTDEDYARTHAIALQATELRTDELRKERGLLGPGVRPTYTIQEKDIGGGETHYTAHDSTGRIIASDYAKDRIERLAERWASDEETGASRIKTPDLMEKVWDSWKAKSSEGLSLSLQLAAAREFNGVHRMTPAEVQDAEDYAHEYGGIATLQAYVRAQWEVTQTVMAKAGESKIDVYRAIMLSGEDVRKTANQPLDKSGKPLPVLAPTNIKPILKVQYYGGPEIPHTHVSFDYDNEHFVVEKEVVMAKPPGSTEETAKIESDAEAVQRRITQYESSSQYRARGVLTKLPEIKILRAGAQSTTGSQHVANDWGGIGDLPPDPVRVVIRVEAPSTSVLSLPVFGQNIQEEHESVLIGTRDKWLWDAWRNHAPDFKSHPMSSTTKKADTQPLVIDLQAEDRGKPHWLQGVNWTTVLKWDEQQHPRDPKGQFTEGVGHAGQTGTTETPESDTGAGSPGRSAVQAPSPRHVATQGPAQGEPFATDRVGRPAPNLQVQQEADAYNQAHGLPPIQHQYLPVDELRAGDVADAYEALPMDDSGNPEVRAAYEALAKEVNAQWDAAVAHGMMFEPEQSSTDAADKGPYQSSFDVTGDIRDHRHLFFFTGGEPNPFMAAKDPKTGLTINEKFRAIHDYYGHAAGGYGFGPRGEYNAWVLHSQMFSPLARRAITTETLGQNSWVNFGRQNYDATGNYLNIPPAQRPYAQQKTALLPEHFALVPGEQVLKFAQMLKWDRNQPRGAKGTHEGGRWVKGVSQGVVPKTNLSQMFGTIPGMERGGGNYADIMNAPSGTGFGNQPRITGASPEQKEQLAALNVRPPTGDPAVQSALSSGTVTDSEPVDEQGVNTTLIVTMDDENHTKAILKPEVGETWTGSFSNEDINEYITNRQFSLAEREAMAFEVDQALGLGMVPVTVHRTSVEGVEGMDAPSESGYDSYELREMYEAYREKAREKAMDDVSGDMAELWDEHVQEVEKRAGEVRLIWDRIVAENPDRAAAAAEIRAHPVLPMGSQDAFERKTPELIDPFAVLNEAEVDTSAGLSDDEKEKVEDILRRHLEAGAERVGPLDEDAVREKDYDHWLESHADTEARMIEEKVQSITEWRRSQGYGSGAGGTKNPEAPHPQGGSLQHFVEGLSSYGDMSREDGVKMAVLDYVIGTMDRHANNLKFDGDRPVAIDNGYSQPASRTPDGFTFRSAAVEEWLGQRDSTVPDDLRKSLTQALEMTDWQAMLDRHPGMNRLERNAFLGRIERMKVALTEELGLYDLWREMKRY